MMYFKPIEFLVNCTGEEIYEFLSNSDLYGYLLNLMLRLNDVRTHLGLPIIVTSGFRNKKHNKGVGGVSSSQHLYAQAADITCKDMAKLRKSIEVFSHHFGQVIDYGSFIHVALPCDRHPNYEYKKAKK